VLIVPGVAGMRQGYRGADKEYYRDGFGEKITVQRYGSKAYRTHSALGAAALSAAQINLFS